MFDRQDGCEYIFIWRTSEACPIQKNTGALPSPMATASLAAAT